MIVKQAQALLLAVGKANPHASEKVVSRKFGLCDTACLANVPLPFTERATPPQKGFGLRMMVF